MIVFHGSYTAVNEIDLTKGRINLDFGNHYLAYKKQYLCILLVIFYKLQIFIVYESK
jgi:hypothetical protein